MSAAFSVSSVLKLFHLIGSVEAEIFIVDSPIVFFVSERGVFDVIEFAAYLGRSIVDVLFYPGVVHRPNKIIFIIATIKGLSAVRYASVYHIG